MIMTIKISYKVKEGQERLKRDLKCGVMRERDFGRIFSLLMEEDSVTRKKRRKN